MKTSTVLLIMDIAMGITFIASLLMAVYTSDPYTRPLYVFIAVCPAYVYVRNRWEDRK